MASATNQKGYTLLLTLVITVILFLIISTFTVASMNQNKQIKSTDTTFLATSNAEMGIEKFESVLNKEIDNNKTLYEACKNSGKSDYECYKTAYTTIYNNVLKTPSTYNDPSLYNIEIAQAVLPANLTQTIAENHIIKFKSIGKVPGDSKTKFITASIKLPFQMVSISAPENLNESYFSLGPITTANSHKPSKVSDIKAKDIDDYFSRSKVNVLNPNGSFEQVKANPGQLPNGLSNLKIYSEGTIDFSKFVDTSNQTKIQAKRIVFSHSSQVQTDINNSFLRAEKIDHCSSEKCADGSFNKSISVSNSCIIVNDLTKFLLNTLRFDDSTSSINPLAKSKVYFFNQNSLNITSQQAQNYIKVANFKDIDPKCGFGSVPLTKAGSKIEATDYQYN